MSTQLNPKKETKVRPLNTFPDRILDETLFAPSSQPLHAHGDETERRTAARPKPSERLTPISEPDLRIPSQQPRDDRKQIQTRLIPSSSPWMYLFVLSVLAFSATSEVILPEARPKPPIPFGPKPSKKPTGLPPRELPNQQPKIETFNLGFEEVAAFPDLWNAALDRGDAKEVEKLFDKFKTAPDTLRTPYKSQRITPLAKAALRGDEEMVMMLLRKGSDPYWKMPESYGKKALLDVVLKKNPKLASKILSYSTFGMTADDQQTHANINLISAVMDKNVDELRNLLKLNPDLNEVSTSLAMFIEDLACAEALVKHPKTLDLLIRDRNGKETLLQKDGSHLSHLDKPVADYLFNAATKQKQARDAIIKAIVKDDAEKLTAILDKYQFHPDFTKHSDEFDSGSKTEGTFLLFAVRLQKLKCMNILLAKGADPHAKGTTTRITRDGRASTTTPFAAVGLVATTEVLDGFMEYHPEIDINQNDGFGTLVFKAALADNLPMLKKALFTYKADPNTATTQELILGLVKHKKFEALEILIEAGADLSDTPPTIAEILKNLGTDNAEVASLVEKIFLRAMETENLPLVQSFIDHQWLENPSTQQITAAKKYFGTEHTITQQLLQNTAKKTSDSNESNKESQQKTAQWSMSHLLGLSILAGFGILSFGYWRKKESTPDGNMARTNPDDPQEKTPTDRAAKQAGKLEDKKRTSARELERENARAEQEYIELPNSLNILVASLEKLIDENKISPVAFIAIKSRFVKIKEELQEIIIETNTNSLVNKVGSLKLLIKELEELRSYCDKHTNCHQKRINLTQKLTLLEPDILAALRVHNKKLKIISASIDPKKDQLIKEYKEKYINPLAKISHELTSHHALLEKIHKQFDAISDIPISIRLEACVKLQAELTTLEASINEFLKNSRGKVEVGLTRKEIDQEKPENVARDKPKKTEFAKKDNKKPAPRLLSEPAKLLPPSAAMMNSYSSSDESSTFSSDDSSTSASGYDTLISIPSHRLSPAPTEADNFSGVLRISQSKDEKNIRVTAPSTAVSFFKQPKRAQQFQKFAQLKIQADKFNELLSQPAEAKSEISALAYQGAMFFFAENLLHTDKFSSSFGITHKGLRRLRDNLIYHREKFKDFSAKDWQIIYQCFMQLLFDANLAEPLGTETRGGRDAKLQLLIQDYGHKKEKDINYSLEDHDSLGEQFAKFNSVADSQPASEKLLWDCAKQFSIGLKGYKEYVRKVGMGYASMEPQIRQAKKQGDQTRHETTIDKLLADVHVATVTANLR